MVIWDFLVSSKIKQKSKQTCELWSHCTKSQLWKLDSIIGGYVWIIWYLWIVFELYDTWIMESYWLCNQTFVAINMAINLSYKCAWIIWYVVCLFHFEGWNSMMWMSPNQACLIGTTQLLRCRHSPVVEGYPDKCKDSHMLGNFQKIQ